MVRDQIGNSQKGYNLQADSIVSDQMPIDKVNQNNSFHRLEDSYEEKYVSSSLGSDTVMVGAVTAALGSSTSKGSFSAAEYHFKIFSLNL